MSFRNSGEGFYFTSSLQAYPSPIFLIFKNKFFHIEKSPSPARGEGKKEKMGKSKRRILHKGINDKITNIKREDALSDIVKACNAKKIDENALSLITLFGFCAEELLEAGAQYEDVLGLRGVLGN